MKFQLGLSKEQFITVVKVCGYVAVSAVISYLIAETTSKPELFGPLTPIINMVLVFVKQFVTAPKE